MQERYFYQKIGSVMKDNMFDRYVSGYRSGKLDNNSLYKTQIGGQDRIFKRRTERANKKYNVAIMVDESGSMHFHGMETTDENGNKSSEERIRVSAGLVTTLIRGLEENNIDFSVIGYNAKIYEHKKFDHKLRENADKLREEMILNSHDEESEDENGHVAYACNHDLLAVRKVASILRGRSGRSIVCVFSDGRPNCDYKDCRENGIHYNRDNTDKLKSEVRALAQKYDVITFGIGTSEAEEYYPNCVEVNDREDFMGKLIDKLGKLIKRG